MSGRMRPRLCHRAALLIASLLRSRAVLFDVAELGWPPIWPEPMQYSNGSTTVTLSVDFRIDVEGGGALVAEARDRALALLPARVDARRRRLAEAAPELDLLRVRVGRADGDDEAYALRVGVDGVATLDAAAPRGALHGLESFAQLVGVDAARGGGAIAGAPWRVVDAPRFAHRGVMLDTARHWLPVAAIVRVLDGMAAAKLNVLHWHLTDREAFPLRLRCRPELALGAHSPAETRVRRGGRAPRVSRAPFALSVRFRAPLSPPSRAGTRRATCAPSRPPRARAACRSCPSSTRPRTRRRGAVSYTHLTLPTILLV